MGIVRSKSTQSPISMYEKTSITQVPVEIKRVMAGAALHIFYGLV